MNNDDELEVGGFDGRNWRLGELTVGRTGRLEVLGFDGRTDWDDWTMRKGKEREILSLISFKSKNTCLAIQLIFFDGREIARFKLFK